MNLARLDVLPLAAILSLSVLACRTAGSDEPPKAAMVEAPPTAVGAPGSGELALDTTPSPSSSAPPPTEGAPKHRHPGNDRPPEPEPLAIGAPCAASAPAMPADVKPCGAKGRVSIMWSSSKATPGGEFTPRCTPAAITKDGTGGDRTSACITDGRLYVQSACIMCRLVGAGWSGVALIAEMTPEQAMAVQKKLGLPAKEPLLTEESWRKTLAAARR